MIKSVKREYCVIALRAHHQQKLREKIGSEELWGPGGKLSPTPMKTCKVK